MPAFNEVFHPCVKSHILNFCHRKWLCLVNVEITVLGKSRSWWNELNVLIIEQKTVKKWIWFAFYTTVSLDLVCMSLILRNGNFYPLSYLSVIIVKVRAYNILSLVISVILLPCKSSLPTCKMPVDPVCWSCVYNAS